MNLKSELMRELTEHIAPFWEKMKDIEQGGFYGYMDFDLRVDKTYEKGCILNSRILWFFSNAYMLLNDKVLLDMADHAYYFMEKRCVDRKEGGIYWSVTYDGHPLDTTKHTYNQAFAIYALSSYFRATGNAKALDQAMKLFDIIETKCIDRYGYLESFDRCFRLQSNDKLSENGLMADKTMNTLLHVLEAYTELYLASPNPRVEKALHRILLSFQKDIYSHKSGHLEVFFDEKLNSISDLYSYGHDIEASWLIDRAACVTGDEKLIATIGDFTQKLADEVYKHAYSNYSLNNECFKGQVDTTRVWWVQAEAMVGFYNCYEKTQNINYMLVVENIWNYIKKYIIDKRPGSEWFWDVNETGQPKSQKPIVEPWKCPYHNGRMCMELIRRIKE